MKTIETNYGFVEVVDCRIIRKSSYGQYSIIVDCLFLGAKHQLSIHSTDSELYDYAQDSDDHSETVYEGAKYKINSEIENHFNSL